MKKTVSTLMALLLLMNGWCFVAQSAVAQTGIKFSDPVLESRVRAALGKPEGDVTAEDAASLEWLDAQTGKDAPDSERIKDVSDLRYFVNLNGVKLDNNAVDDVSALAGLSALRELSLLGNPMGNIESLSNLTGLVKLGFDSGFRDVAFVGNMPNLEELRIDACRDLPATLTKLSKLKVFCSLGGELTDISLLAQIPTLTTVDLSWNMVTDVTPLARLPLTELYLAGNPIDDFSPIRELMPRLVGKNFDYFELQQPENPDQVLSFSDPLLEQKIRKAIEKPQGDITAGDAAKIARLDIGNEWAKEIPASVQVTSLQGIEALINLRVLNATFNAISDIGPLSALSQLQDVDLGGNAIRDLSPLSALKNLISLKLYGNGIRDIRPLAGLTTLQSLHLGNNNVGDISVLAGLTKLRYLYLGMCGIEDISPLASMAELCNLELSDNYITDLSALAG